MKKLFLGLLIVFIILPVPGVNNLLWAQASAISIDLTFDKYSYNYGDPVGVDIVVRNLGGEVLISRGFSSMVYYLEMRVIDPAGRLLLANRNVEHNEFPDAPPLPFILYQGRPIRVASCEVLPPGWFAVSQTNDLRAYYPMELPGFYSAQVQLSAMTFKGQSGDPCDVTDYQWVGVLKSETKYFFMEGNTQVQIAPDQWPLSWKNDHNIPDVQVHISPEEGKTTDDYLKESIRLNNVVAHRVEELRPMLKAYFDRKAAIESLGAVEVDKWYPVVISGWLKSGQPFGGVYKIRIVH